MKVGKRRERQVAAGSEDMAANDVSGEGERAG